VVSKRNFVPFAHAASELAIESIFATESSRSRLGPEHHAAARKFSLGWTRDDFASQRDGAATTIELPATREVRALSAQVGASGGFGVGEGFVRAWVAAMTATPMLSVANIEMVERDGLRREALLDDTANKAGPLNENTASTASDISWQQLVYVPVKYGTGRFTVPSELVEDAADFSLQFAKVAGGRLARALNFEFTNGTGITQAMGIVPALVQNGAIVTANSSSVIASDDVFSLFSKIGSAYLSPDCVFMSHPAVYADIKKLKDGEGKPLLDTRGLKLDGLRWIGNPDMASTIASGAVSLLFGQFDFYHAKLWRDLRITRSLEAHAETDQTAWYGFARAAGNLADAGEHPIVGIQH
jgi:HK97 family phage major capsid protein